MTKALRILHTEASCGWGGQEIRILSESQRLAERGHHLTIATPKHGMLYQRASQCPDIHVVDLPLHKKTIGNLLAVRRWLKANPVDVINTHSTKDACLVALAQCLLKRRIPTVRTRHLSLLIKREPFTRWLYTRATKHIVTTGTLIKSTLEQRNGYPADRITSVRTGIDLTRYQKKDPRTAKADLGLAADKQYIILVANLRPSKGTHLLLEAWQRIEKCYPSWQVLIVGDGLHYPELKEQVKRLGLQSRVKMVGHQDYPEKWLQASDLFVLPTFTEGVSQSVMQAMAVGLPIITTPVGSTTDILEEGVTGILIPPGEPEAIVRAITDLIDNKSKREMLGNNAHAFAQAHCGIESMTDVMEHIFYSVANRHKCD